MIYVERSLHTLSNHRSCGGGCPAATGRKRPALAMRAARPRAFSDAVLPPVFGPAACKQGFLYSSQSKHCCRGEPRPSGHEGRQAKRIERRRLAAGVRPVACKLEMLTLRRQIKLKERGRLMRWVMPTARPQTQRFVISCSAHKLIHLPCQVDTLHLTDQHHTCHHDDGSLRRHRKVHRARRLCLGPRRVLTGRGAIWARQRWCRAGEVFEDGDRLQEIVLECCVLGERQRRKRRQRRLCCGIVTSFSISSFELLS